MYLSMYELIRMIIAEVMMMVMTVVIVEAAELLLLVVTVEGLLLMKTVEGGRVVPREDMRMIITLHRELVVIPETLVTAEVETLVEMIRI